jgi:aspartyl-tRNA(Asn)/glutamyl-tRNA(Gln) amidotransferase subunit C
MSADNRDPAQIVEYACRLAMLEISEDQRRDFSEQIGKILDFVNKLDELDTENAAPTAHILPVKNVCRKDVPVESLSREAFLRAAPDHDGECLKVPNVIQDF